MRFGVAWLGNTFVAGHEASIKEVAGDWVKQTPAMLAVAFFFASMLLYSQAATAKAIVPVIITALGISAANPHDSYMLVACFAAVSALLCFQLIQPYLVLCKWMIQERLELVIYI